MKNLVSILIKKKAVFWVLMFVLIVGVLELGATLFYLIKEKKYASVVQLLKEERKSYGESLTDNKCSFINLIVPHPWLGYVYRKNSECALEVNNVGMTKPGPDFPYKKDPDVFYVLFTGGSAADLMMSVSREYIEDALNDRFILPHHKKKLVLLRGGVGAWFQPAQLIFFLMNAHVLDGVITLDGFNEHLHIDGDLRMDHPAATYFERGDDLAIILTQLYSDNYSFSQKNWLMAHSHLLYLGGNVFRELIKKIFLWKSSMRRDRAFQYFQLPPSWKSEQVTLYNIELYKSYVRSFDTIAKQRGIRSLFLLQPHPHIMKKLTEKEKQVAVILKNPLTYKNMVEKLLQLRGEKIEIFSLLDIFSEVQEDIYQDHIHYIMESRENGEMALGYKLMSERIIDLISKTWKLQKK